METKQTGAMAGDSALPRVAESPAKKKSISEVISELPPDKVRAAIDSLSFKEVLNSPPPAKWIKKHPLGGFDYLPIDKVELLLDLLFKNWEVRVLNYNVIVNSICVQVELRVTMYSGEERIIHGLGAAPIHTERGASPVDQSKVLTDSVMKALPAAKSFALKDAAEHLGDIFGRNIGKNDVVKYVDLSRNLTDNLTKKIKNINI